MQVNCGLFSLYSVLSFSILFSLFLPVFPFFCLFLFLYFSFSFFLAIPFLSFYFSPFFLSFFLILFHSFYVSPFSVFSLSLSTLPLLYFSQSLFFNFKLQIKILLNCRPTLLSLSPNLHIFRICLG